MFGVGGYMILTLMMVVCLLLSWFLTSFLGLTGMAQTVVRMLLMGFIGAGFAGLYAWRAKRERAKTQPGADAQAAAAGAEKEIEVFIRDAETRLAQSIVGKEAKLAQLPVFFLLGEKGSAKTSIFVHSGVEPDLLAGQVYQDNMIVPTRPVNFWLAQKSVFVEAGGQLVADAGRWATLIKRVNPKGRNPFRRRPHSPRAAIVYLDGETFLQPNAEESLTLAARNLRTRLGEISQSLGIRLPVYVVFSKLDRLGNFTDFVGNLTDEEVMHVLGVTLPLRADREQGGVYAEEESRRLTAAFDGLFRALCDKRLAFLAREHDTAKLPAVYEFPREFRKLRNSVVRFLVDLGRPSQLRANPFLRGFYFSGVRPVVIKENAPVLQRPAPAQGYKRAATGFFGSPSLGVADDPVGDPARTRRVPQWLFLGHLFSNVVLRDRAALGASGQSLRTELMRRIVAGSVAGLCLLWSLGLTVSFFRNRDLEARVSGAVHNISRETGGAAQELPSLDSLQRLDALRETVRQLWIWRLSGAPWSYRWGLYVGDDLYNSARSLYFSSFYHLLFGQTQLALLDWMNKLPDKPRETDRFDVTYNVLKAYLLTTSESAHIKDQGEAAFLPPLLTEKWAAGRTVDGERQSLAGRQFEFYTEELASANPFSRDSQSDTVKRARAFLGQFGSIDIVYQGILSDARKDHPAVNFNGQFPQSKPYVVNDQDVDGAFSLDGYKYVQKAIDDVKSHFGGERWVLGEEFYAALDPERIKPLLRDRYHQEFLANWRKYLANSRVASYQSVKDAADKLQQLSSNRSYLMGLFCLASVNIAAAGDIMTTPYQPVGYVTSPDCANQYVQKNNGNYIAGLATLQNAMAQVAQAGANPAQSLITDTLTAATNALTTTKVMEGQFTADRAGNIDRTVSDLLEAPIRNAQAVLVRLGPAQLNSEGGGVCKAYNDLVTKKYPFVTSSPDDTSLAEFDHIFRPGDGVLPQFYDRTLKNYVVFEGGQYVRKPDNRVQITDAFLRFFNHAMGVTTAMYKNGAREPSVSYTMRALPAEGMKSVTLTLDGQVLKSDAKGGQSQDFTWPGASGVANLAGNLGQDFSFIHYDGLWAVFRFFGDSDGDFHPSGAGYSLQWIPRQGKSGQSIRLDNGKTLILPFFLDLKGAPPIFKPGYLAEVPCAATVAR